MPYQAPLYRLQGKTRHSAPAAYLNACHEIHETLEVCTSWHGKASRRMKSGHEIHEMPDPCTSCQYYPDGALICGWHHHRNMRPPVITARRCGELARRALLAPGCCLLSTKYTKCWLNVKFQLFWIFFITGTKQAERAHWRSSRSLL